MTALQARLFAGRCLREARAQEELARAVRPTPAIPSQRPAGETSGPSLTVVRQAEPDEAR